MFTGIVTALGEVRAIEKRGDTHIAIAAPFDVSGLDIGASVACSGCCLTVVERDAKAGTFSVTASAETLACTNIGAWRVGTAVNLERPLRIGDELGGHIVTGHIDGVAEVVSLTPEGESTRIEFAAPEALAKFIAPKGSIALDGVSLTVNAVNGKRFGVNIIPHTAKVTNFSELKPGSKVNLEADLMMRYVARLSESMK
jgi:riboflavin synthase